MNLRWVEYALTSEETFLPGARRAGSVASGWENVLRAADEYSLKTEMTVHATRQVRYPFLFACRHSRVYQAN